MIKVLTKKAKEYKDQIFKKSVLSITVKLDQSRTSPKLKNNKKD